MSRGAAAMAVALPLAALVAWAVLSGDGGGTPGGAGARSGPEVTLFHVSFREIRDEGADYRMTCDRAVYAVAAKTMTGEGVTVALPGLHGGIVVRAPRAAWALGPGRLVVPEGADAEGAGWQARVPEASLNLPARVLTAPAAVVSGPGLSVAGDNLVWRWKEGAMTLDFPRSRVEPAKAQRRG